MRISIITPCHIYDEKSYQDLLRAIESVKKQKFNKKKMEHVIVNDGSTYPVKVPKYPWIRVINQENLQRYTAYNTGFKKAKGQIFTLLDHDDEYNPMYLYWVDRWFKLYPKYKMFNFGCAYVHADGGLAYREAFEPKEEKVGHEVFGGGKIVNGTFVFHRSVYEDLGAFPPQIVKDIDCSEINYGTGPRELHMWSPYDFSAYYQMKYPEIRQFFFVDQVNEPNKIIKELGNPFGNDYALFYQYTRKYHSKPMKEKFLYYVHP
jgi:glycosyltransferase involved in cell wall biosynthesis